jgi:inner membrane protein
VWLLLAAGLVWSTRRERKGRANWTQPATAALVAATVYAAIMATLGRLAESQVRFELRGQGGSPREVLASPLPVTPFEREVVVAEPDGFRIGAVRVGGSFEEQGRWPHLGDGGPIVAAAADAPPARAFLAWARYPTFLVDRRGGITIVHFIDLRYARAPGPGFGTLAVPLPVGQMARVGPRELTGAIRRE